MRDDLERLLDDLTLVSLTLAVAAGWSLYQLAHGIAIFFDTLTGHLPSDSYSLRSSGYGMTWVVDSRVVSLDGVFIGLVELAVLLTVAVFVSRRGSSA